MTETSTATEAAERTSPQSAESASLDVPSDAPRVITLRAILLGFCAAAFISAYAYFNDYVLRQNLLIGNHFPIFIYGGLFLVLVVVNPLLTVAGRRWKFVTPLRQAEMAVIMAIALTSCAVPTSGAMRPFVPMLVSPQQVGRINSDWEMAEPDKYLRTVNPDIFPERDENGVVYDGFTQGLSQGKGNPPLRETPLIEWIGNGIHSMGRQLSEVPYRYWSGPARTWYPIYIVYFVFIVSMCRVVHRQWSLHEQLSYPLAEFANTLMRNVSGRPWAEVFYNRSFWLAFSIPFFIHLINGWNAYDPRMVRIPLSWNILNIYYTKFTFLRNSLGANYFFISKLYFTVIGIAYFLPQDICFSLSLSLPLFITATALSFHFGHVVNGEDHTSCLFGAYVATAAMIVFTGRYYYFGVLKQALFVRPISESDRQAAWACRWFLLSGIGLAWLLTGVGLDWLLATIVVLIVGILYLVLARVSAEAGVPFIEAPFASNRMIIAMFGPAALGPAALYSLQLVNSALMQTTRESLSPYIINNLRLCSRNTIRPAAVGRLMLPALALSLLISSVAILWVIYSNGSAVDSWASSRVPTAFTKEISSQVRAMKRLGQLESSLEISGLDRLSSAVRETRMNFVACFLIGATLVLLNSALRLRYLWWPVHSIIFVFWGSWAVSHFVCSLIVGWLLKFLVLKFSGDRGYQDLKPFFTGIIMGELAAGLFWMAFGVLYYAWNGSVSSSYGIFPG